MFCTNCGNQVPDGSAVCPYCRAPLARPVDAAPTGSRKALPIIALCCGVVGIIVGSVAYISFGIPVVFQNSTMTGSTLLVILTFLLGLAAIICGIIGLFRSIRTGGKKYVAGIILSAIGIYCGINALSYSAMSLVVNKMSGVFAFFDQIPR